MSQEVKKQKVQEFYDGLIYGAKADPQTSLAMIRAFPHPAIEELPQMSVLEVGLGRGEWSIGLAAYANCYRGVDYSSKTVEYVQHEVKELAGKANDAVVLQGDVLSLTFDDCTFDAAFCIGVLHHTPDSKRGFQELYRVLKPDGTLNIMLYGQVQPRNIIRDVLYQLSRLGRRVERRILQGVMGLEKYHFSDALLFNGGGNEVLYKDWYFAPIQSHHTIWQVSKWAEAVGGEVSYVFLDPYRNSLKWHQSWANMPILRNLFCPDFMISIKKRVAK